MRKKKEYSAKEIEKIYEKKYEIYNKWYENQSEKLKRVGREMYIEKYSFEQFKGQYDYMKAQIDMGIDSGIRKGGNVYQYMVREQAYPIDYKKYTGLKKLYKDAGEEINFGRYNTWDEIKEHTPDSVFDLIKKEYHNYIDSGYTGNEAALLIAQMYFGSD